MARIRKPYGFWRKRNHSLDTDDEQIQVKINGVDVFHPNTGEIRSNDTDGIACWFIDTDYNEESLGDAAQRYVTAFCQATVGAYRGEGHQSLGR